METTHTQPSLVKRRERSRIIPTTEPRKIYDEIYCARGEMENRIKEQQLGLLADRTSCRG